MDSSDLTIDKRNRVTANSLQGRIALPHSKPTRTETVLSYKLGSKPLKFQKRDIFAECCAETMGEEPIPPTVLSSFDITGSVIIGQFVYVAGNFDEQTTLYLVNRTGPLQTSSVEPQITLTTPFSAGILAKYSFDGALQWVTQIDGINIGTITTDGIDLYIGGNQYQSGGSISNSVPNFGQPNPVMTFSLAGSVIAKYNTNGIAIWGTQIENSELFKIEFSNGELYLSSIFLGTINFYNANGLSTPTASSSLLPVTSGPDSSLHSNILLSKYSVNGSALMRTHIGGNILNAQMSIDNGNIYIGINMNYFQNTADPIFYNSDDTSSMTLFIPTDQRVTPVLAKYNTNGYLEWVTKAYSNGSFDAANNISFSLNAKNNKIYLTLSLNNIYGSTGSSVSNFYYNAAPSFGNPTLAFTLTEQSTRNNSTFFQYDANGQFVWCSLIKATTLNNLANNEVGLSPSSIDTNGNIYIRGVFLGQISFYNPANSLQMILNSDSTEYNIFDILITKYDPNGNLLWATKMSSLGQGNYSGGLQNIDPSNFVILGRFSDANPKKIYQPNGLNAPTLTNTFNSNQSAFMVKYTV